MANVNPIQVQKALGGMDYPAGKQQILDHARQQGADQEVVSALEQIPDREYDGPSGVQKEIEF
ncbi:MAG TPA: DUF2795 domain-containing protein [Gaiellaceae bacterium]|nr:DUF2795 domain-containing protein [Gaiellaceae bacterium]